MTKRTVIEIGAKELKDVLIAYLRTQAGSDVDESTFRVCMKDVYNPFEKRFVRVFDRCRIEKKEFE